MRFYLGAHRPNWLWDPQMTDVPLFVSDVTLRDRKTPFPRAVTTYAVDSGAFSELSQHGEWTTTPEEYVARLRRYWAELGPFDWAAQQDSMCEPFILAKIKETTGRDVTVDDQLHATVDNFLRCRELAPELPIAPTIQGWVLADYLRCVALYRAAGVDLTTEPVVGVGSVCRRQGSTEIETVLRTLAGMGIRIHGFGVKLEGLELAGDVIDSADSMAWSYAARRETGAANQCCTGPSGCRNCPAYARRWRAQALAAAARAERTDRQMTFEGLLIPVT